MNDFGDDAESDLAYPAKMFDAMTDVGTMYRPELIGHCFATQAAFS